MFKKEDTVFCNKKVVSRVILMNSSINVDAQEAFENIRNDIQSHTIDWFLKNVAGQKVVLTNYYPSSLYWREIYETDVNRSYKEVIANIISL